ncbi:tRNA 2-selenouridine synthase [Desulfotomaculum nigrificans CO-1-SRB]|uniref:tRNA 2-selenouridine synthase n=1 Tax=Desulfotomaculum nigrificans (strain DSM 14880 / VKM B-2319 / CO-1-SRB) TaxID=868595 RepID=F6B603_DESCC|nr:tRNA 2-selenouridine(34) synthase MnmH [Desulfotomaculum nigrificans]AEF94322.1 tRNA 2-selenouridine synthase [Desulfotomaculum nigrificans CO-1-SRB]
MVKDISISEALKIPNACFVDIRSEKEFAEGAIPGAINIPLFNNEERAQVGTTYKQIGIDEAKILGLQIAGPKFPGLFNQLSALSKEKPVVLYCWRGGMRSKYTAAVLSSLGVNLYRIKGGYKEYRRYVHNYLDRQIIPHKSIVLHGLTGVGKTTILKKLAVQGYPVLDLEGLARHRGSAFGKIGLPPSPSQKDFEAAIVQILTSAAPQGMIIVECESRRVGKLIVPPAVFNSMTEGYRVLLYASVEQRVQRIINEYTNGPNNNVEELQKCTTMLTKSLGKRVVEELNAKLSQRNFTEVFTYLLTRYYDPLYKYPDKPSDDYDLSVDCSNLDLATSKIARWVESLPEYGVPVENGGENYADRGNTEESEDGEGLFS